MNATFAYRTGKKEHRAECLKTEHKWDEQWVYGFQDCLRCDAIKVYSTPSDFSVKYPRDDA